MTHRRVLGSEGAVRAFRAGAATPALGRVDPLSKFAIRSWCDERARRGIMRMAINGAINVRRPSGGLLTIVQCVKGEYPRRINEIGDVT